MLTNIGTSNLDVDDVDAASYDICGNISEMSISQSSFDCSDVGVVNVVLTVVDNNGNSNTCSVIVTVEDNSPPTAICQMTTALQLDNTGHANLSPSDVDAGSADVCGIAGLTLSQSSFDCNDAGQNLVTLFVLDNSGNASSCTTNLMITDNVSPIANCISNLTVMLNNTGHANLFATQFDMGSYDVCGTIVSKDISQSTFSCDDIGNNAILLTITDNNGNTSTCSSTVEIRDALSPAISCPSDITVNNDQGECSAYVNYVVSASDNCDYTLTLLLGLPSGSDFPVGNTVVKYNAIDNSGNTVYCTFNITVNMKDDPYLLHAYTAIAFDEIDLDDNDVNSGGLGIINSNKKVILDHGTKVTASTSFVKAPILKKYGGSQVTTYYQGKLASSMIPGFHYNYGNCNNDKYVPQNSGIVTLSLSCYDEIYVGKNATIKFSGHDIVNIDKLELGENAKVIFSQNTELRIEDELKMDNGASIDKTIHAVWIYVEEDLDLENNVKITANVYCKKDIKIEDASPSFPTILKGLFIADEISAGNNTIWYRNENGCNEAGNPPSNRLTDNEENEEELSVNRTSTQTSLSPNPANNNVILQVPESMKEEGLVEVFDNQGKRVIVSKITSGSNHLDVSNWEEGIYLVKIQLINTTQITKLMIVR